MTPRLTLPVGQVSITRSAKDIGAELVADREFRAAIRALIREVVAEILADRKRTPRSRTR